MSQGGSNNFLFSSQGLTGTFTLSGMATTVVDNSAVTADSVILYSLMTLGTVTSQSTLTYTITPGVSFTITSNAPTDTSTYGYVIFN